MLTDNEARELSRLATEITQLEDRIKNGTDLLSNLKQQLNVLQTEKLPELMLELGVRQIALESGEAVSLKPFCSASIPKDRKPEAFAWLEENGYGDIIKHTLSVQFGREEGDAANALKEQLSSEGYVPRDEEKVEPMTLKAFVREQVEAGTPIPLDLFGAYVGQKATITRRK